MKPAQNPAPLRDAKGHFVKGQSGHPGGRKGAVILSHAYRDKLETVCLDDPKHRTYAEMIADRMVALALNGDISAAVEIADRIEGKARQSVDLQQMSSPYDVSAARERLFAAMEAEEKKVQ